MKMYSVVDLFAGAGGLSQGFECSQRYDIKAAFEKDLQAQETYRKNHAGIDVYGDVLDVDFDALVKQYGNIDVVIGGPPCQGFSNANRQRSSVISLNNALVKAYVNAVKHIRPVAFVMENVAMLRSDTHRFIIGSNDHQYAPDDSIAKRTHIVLLDKSFVFDKAVAIVKDIERIKEYIWPDEDYRVLNILYKLKNSDDKHQTAFHRHEKKLIQTAVKYLGDHRKEFIAEQNRRAWRAICRGYRQGIAGEIETAVMLQRMLRQAKELHDNNIPILIDKSRQDLAIMVNSVAVLDHIKKVLGDEFEIVHGVLNAVEFGVPQKRERYVLIGVRKSLGIKPTLPIRSDAHRNTVRDAIEDLADIDVKHSASEDTGTNLPEKHKRLSELAKTLRNADTLFGHITPHPSDMTIRRFKALKQGENFHDLDDALKEGYADISRTQNTIYQRLIYDEPSGTVVNVRKSMWIHPEKDRALSAREAARLQTFPDSFRFCGAMDSQYQQIGNAVPPKLAEAIAVHLADLLDSAKS